MRVIFNLIFSALMTTIVGCQTSNRNGRNGSASIISSFTIAEYVVAAGDPAWSNVAVTMEPTNVNQKPIRQTFTHDQFKAGTSSNLSLLVPQGTYNIALNYGGSKGEPLYHVCASAAKHEYLINTPVFKADIPICKVDAGTSPGTIAITPPTTAPIPPAPSGSVLPAAPGLPPSGSCLDDGGRVKPGFDIISGVCVDRTRSFYVQGGEIYNRGSKLLIKGVNWFGLEGASPDASGQTKTELRLGGLWTGRSMESFVDEMAALGFNAWRIPLTPEALDPSTPAFDGFKTIPGELEHLLTYTRSKGMLVLLDMHNCGKNRYFLDKPGPGVAGSGCATYTEDKWIGDLSTLARLAQDHANVIGIDLFNEPFGFSWSEWVAMSSRAAEAVLKINPTILIFMEGIAAKASNVSNSPFWGENLLEASTNVPHIPQSRLVFSPHTYGPSVAGQTYFNVPEFPGNMPSIWDEHFGYLIDQGYSIAVGEFGGTHQGKDKLWGDAFVAYFQQRNLRHFFYWSMNQNSGDTGGLYTDSEWKILNKEKLKLLQPLLDRKI